MISAIRGECSGYPEERFSSGQKRLNKGGDRVLKEEQEFCQARKGKMNILGKEWGYTIPLCSWESEEYVKNGALESGQGREEIGVKS